MPRSRRSRISSARTSIPSRSPARCSSRCRARAASSPCRRTSRAGCKELLSSHGILYVDDEVQSGIGRTGPVWAIEHYGVEPDIVVSGKSLGGGLPLAGVTGRAEVMDAVHPGGLGGTFGGNPLSCAAALAVLDEVATPEFRARADAIGERIRAKLDAIAERVPAVGEVRGLGPMLAMELVADARDAEAGRRTRQACDRARARARAHPPRVRHARERPAAPATARSTPTRSSRKGWPSWRACLSTQAQERPSPIARGGRRGRRPARRGAQDVRRRRRRRLDRPRDPARRVLHDARPVGLRQDDDAAPHRRLRAPDSGQILLGGVDVAPTAAVRARRQHRLPGLRALPAHDRRGERRVRPEGEARPQGRAASARGGGAGDRSPAGVRRRASRRSCQAASDSASRSPARS